MERLINAYRRHRRMPRECMGMWMLKENIDMLRKKDVYRNLPDVILVAFASVISDVSIADHAIMLIPVPPLGENGEEKRRKDALDIALRSATYWVAQRETLYKLRYFFCGYPEAFNKKFSDTLTVLSYLLEKYVPEE